ncbi:hypothetical protein MTO96_035280 [Rhipicephalus appendiculatus]
MQRSLSAYMAPAPIVPPEPWNRTLRRRSLPQHLHSNTLLAFAQDTPGPVVCNAGYVFNCYKEYSSVLFRDELLPNADGSFNDTSYLSACSFFTADSTCQLSMAHCPKPFRDQFARSEEGYKATRAIVCDAPSLQGLVRLSLCLNNDRLHKCVESPMTKPKNGTNPREHWCKLTQDSLRCVDEGSHGVQTLVRKGEADLQEILHGRVQHAPLRRHRQRKCSCYGSPCFCVRCARAHAHRGG